MHLLVSAPTHMGQVAEKSSSKRYCVIEIKKNLTETLQIYLQRLKELWQIVLVQLLSLDVDHS